MNLAWNAKNTIKIITAVEQLYDFQRKTDKIKASLIIREISCGNNLINIIEI